MTDKALAMAIAAAKTDPLRAELNKHIIATAEHILTAPSIRHNNGNAVHEQERYAVYYILTSAMAYRLTGDARFFNRAKSDLFTVAAFPDWDPKGDLSEGEMSFAVAIGYDWLYANLKPDERAIIKQALLVKSLSFADYSYRRGAGWTKGDGNHNQVCNAGMVSAALALADEEPDLARRVIEKNARIWVASFDNPLSSGPIIRSVCLTLGLWTVTRCAMFAFCTPYERQ